MRKDDARKLDHKTLEEMRIRAVKRIQDGESPEIVARVLGVDRGPAHIARKTRTFVEGLNGSLRLFYLPPYSPDSLRYAA